MHCKLKYTPLTWQCYYCMHLYIRHPQCENKDGRVSCPEPPPVVIDGGPIVVRAILLLLESIGAEGIIGFVGGLTLILGFIKLTFGGVICCRKTKAQEFADRAIEKGGMQKGMYR